jgi:predicted hydrocarbon binding protein
VVGIFEIAALVYVVGSLWSVFALMYSIGREGGHAFSKEALILTALAFFLWPFILLETIFISIRNRERERVARARGRV